MRSIIYGKRPSTKQASPNRVTMARQHIGIEFKANLENMDSQTQVDVAFRF